jgi:hypothetical protein
MMQLIAARLAVPRGTIATQEDGGIRILSYPRKVTAISPVQTLWSYTHTVPWRGLALARERNLTLAWDVRHTLHLFNRHGQPQAEWPCPGELIDAACADDGSSFAAVGARGEVWLLAPDLSVRWERRVPGRAEGVAVEGFGQYLAVSDRDGMLHLFNRLGQTVWQALNARPLCHLAFVPEQAQLVGSADFGLTACYDSAGRCLWRDGLVAHVGSLAVSGNGSALVLACYSEGLCFYHQGNPKTRRFLANTAPAHRAALSYDGRTLLTTDRESRLVWRGADQKIQHEFKCDGKPVALVLEAVGERAVVAFADGKIIGTEARP